MSILDKFKIGFKKSAYTFTSGLRDIIVKKEINDKTLNQIEEYLIQSDVGITAAEEIKKIIAQEKIDPNKDTINEVNIILKNYIINLMQPLENTAFFLKKDYLNVILISGVNGVGKTTTIGKLGKILKSNGSKVMFSACDTFRAAAIEQLENWANKIDVQIIKSNQGSDPASVAYKAIDEAMKNNSGNPLFLLNVGSNFEISIKDLAIKISKVIGYQGEILWDKSKPDGTPRKILDSSKLQKMGWVATTDLDKGIELTIQNYRKEMARGMG